MVAESSRNGAAAGKRAETVLRQRRGGKRVRIRAVAEKFWRGEVQVRVHAGTVLSRRQAHLLSSVAAHDLVNF
jgi:hypothetical protein